MITNTTNSQTPEILAKQVVEWRKEVARLNDLIAHAEGRDSQAASIDTDPFFCKLLSRIAEFGFTGEHDKALIACIDAKLAQAREEGINSANDFRALVSDSDAAEIKEWKHRATSAESRLAEIQRGVEGLHTYIVEIGFGKLDVEAVSKEEVLAILAPQGQASDTSGLPG